MDKKEVVLEALRAFLSERENTLSLLRALQSDVQKHHAEMNKAKIAGSSLSIGGFGAGIVGFILFPFTLGGSLALAAAGAVVAVAGGATVIGATASDAIRRKKVVKCTTDALKKDEIVLKYMKEKCKKFQKQITDCYSTKSIVRDEERERVELAVYVLDIAGGVGQAAGACANVGIQAARVGIEVASTAGKVGIQVAGTAAKAFSIGGVVFGALIIPFDIVTIAVAADELEKYGDGVNCDAARVIAELIPKLEEHYKIVQKFYQMLVAGAFNYTEFVL